MAKAKQIEGLDCDADAAAMAARALTVRFDEILTFHTAALEPDGIDGVHDMRVASRRFRSATRDFAPLFDKKDAKTLQKHVKAIANTLGSARDLDVAIQALKAMQERAPNDVIANGIERLIADRHSQRSRAHSEIIAKVTPEQLEKILSEFSEMIEGADKGSGARDLRAFAADVIERALNKFLERSESIYSPFEDDLLHKLRLSAKRLRYALELFNDCWNGELKPFAKYVSKFQSSLGEVHDSSEWLKFLSESISGTDLIDRQTAVWLISEFVTLRTAEYLKALDLWNEWLRSDLNGQLNSIIRK
jgi:CHAD domain-containing protein